jgi:excisionase family DNA binding protein
VSEIIEQPKRGRGRPRRIISNAAGVAVIRQRIEGAKPAGRVMMVSPKHAAELIDVSERTIHALIAKGELPSALIGGSRRIFVDDLKALATAGVQQIGGTK